MHAVVLHDELVREVRDAVALVGRDDVADAFVSALRPRRFEHWSTLASYAFARSLPEHAFSAPENGRACRICGAYRLLEAFPADAFRNDRTRGVVRIDSLRYTLYDLETFRNETFDAPSESDRAFYAAALGRITNLPSNAKTFAAEASLAQLFPSRIERKLFLGVLGVCGILASPGRPGFWPDFVAFEHRARLDPSPYVYPVAWWRGSYGIDEAAVRAIGLDRFLPRTPDFECDARSERPWTQLG